MGRINVAKTLGFIAGVGVVVIAATALAGLWPEGSRRAVTSLEELERSEVIYLADLNAFLVDSPNGPLALYGVSTHSPYGRDERVLFCRSSGLFEATDHGEKFTRTGGYFGGPAPRGMDRFLVQVVNGRIYVDPSNLIEGPPRPPQGSAPIEVEGPFCVPDGAVTGDAEPGFWPEPQ